MSFNRRCNCVLLALAFCGQSCASVGKQSVLRPFDQPPVHSSSEEQGARESPLPVESFTASRSVLQHCSTEQTAAAVDDLSDSESASSTSATSQEPAGERVPSDLADDSSGSEAETSIAILPQPPAAVDLTLTPAPVAESDHPFPINLAAALRLADARPLVVAAAQASAWVAEAQLQHAQLLWVPQFNIGAVYYRHDGFGPDFNYGVNNHQYGGPTPGGPLNQNLNYFYAYGSFYQSVNLTDAIFQPLASRQTLDAQRLDIQTAKNDALLATAYAYFDVHKHRGQYAAALHVVDRSQALVDRLEALSRDLIPAVEVARGRRLHASLQQQAVSAREKWRVSSADLTQVLRLDPSAVVIPLESDHAQITLIDLERPLDELIAMGMAQRPEIPASAARVRAAEVRVRREKNRPLLPLVLITGFQTPGGMISQFGVFGTGSDRSMNHWSLRNDVSLQLIWQLEGFGFGNLARIKDQRGQESKAIVDLFRQQDMVAAEVTSAQARAQAGAVRVLQTERELREAVVNYDGNYEGLAQTTRFGDVLELAIRPQEAVRALGQLMKAYDEYFATVAEYNRAQFKLYHAVGYPARCVSELEAAGEPVSVDRERPFDLPPVSEGPPPANR